MEEIKDTAVAEQELSEVLRIRREKLANLQADGNDPFVKTKFDFSDYTSDIKADFEKYNEKTVRIAGRIMSRRIMGKASFFNLQDSLGNIQIYIRRDDVGEDVYAAFKKWDIGDIVGLEGFVFLTKTGEISIHAEEVTLLSKSLQVLPEKFHGLTNTDMRYRQRYVDLVMNQEARETFIKRSK
ncbi:MAG: lysine--tRNA ligase, partial [Clostridia bacterium]|nr:lysine--tRNA ligase [Clostridia bacterium]